MNKCEKCGRPLNEDENGLCPACKSKKSHKKKRWFEVIASTLSAAGIIIVAVCGKDRWKTY